MIRIIDSNKDYVIAVKPYGVMSEWDEGRANMPDELSKTLGISREQIYTVHRLDTTTEGLMAYALSKKAAAELSACIAEGRFHKTYIALVTAAEDLPSEGEMTDMLFFDRRQGKSFVVSGDKKGAKEARLKYELLEPIKWRENIVTPARIELFTGRTHQIRAQFAARRSPLIGDGKYGSRVNYKRPSLFSCALSFEWKEEKISCSLDYSENNFSLTE